MRTKALRTYDPTTQQHCNRVIGHAWLSTLRSKARRTKAHTAAGWAYRQLACRLGAVLDADILEAEPGLDAALLDLSGCPEVQA